MPQWNLSKKKKKKPQFIFTFALWNTKAEKYLAQNLIVELNYNTAEMVDMHTKIKAEVFDP